MQDTRFFPLVGFYHKTRDDTFHHLPPAISEIMAWDARRLLG